MKKYIDQHCKGVLLTLILFLLFNEAYNQNQDGSPLTPLTKWASPFLVTQKSTLSESSEGLFLLGGSTTDSPLAKFHIIGSSFEIPSFKVDDPIGGFFSSNVEINTRKNSQSFAIWQNSSSDAILNFFSNKIIIGDGLLSSTELLNVNGLGFFKNKVQIGDGDYSGANLLSVNGKASVALGFYLGDEVLDNNLPRPRKTFQCGGTLDIKVVPSMSSNITDYTVMTLDFDPDKQVHVKGRLTTETFMITEGAGLQKVMISDAQGNGYWTDLSPYLDRDWKRDHVTGQDIYNNSRNVGINVECPVDRFQVNMGHEKLGIGSSSGASLGWGTSYIGFNAARGQTGWIINSDNSDTPHNGGSVIYGNMFGDILLSTIPSTDPAPGSQELNDATILGNVKMKLTAAGRLGLGTHSPIASIDVYNSGENMINLTTTTSDPVGFKASNTNNSFALLMNRDGIGQLTENQDPILTFKNGRIAIGDIDVSTITSPNQLFVERGITTADINATGTVMIGDITHLPSTPEHKLYVENGITTEEVKVKLQSDGEWSDYVFNKDYNLMSLDDLQKFINEHRHLPEIPDAAQVQKDGIELGQMNALLLKKIEELTLYVMELKQEINKIKTISSDQ